MKPITLFFEIVPPESWAEVLQMLTLSGSYRGPFKDGELRRVWFLCFALSWVRLDLHDHNRHVASGATQWVP